MSGFGGNHVFPDFGTTRNRTTRVTFDGPSYELVEPTFVLQRNAADMCRTNKASLDGEAIAMLGADVGYSVQDIWMDRSLVIENDAHASPWLTTTTANIPSAFEQIYSWKKQDAALFTNLFTGANADMATQGGTFFQKKVEAGSSWQSTIIDSYAFPDVGATNIALDKVLRSTEVDNEWQSLHFEFTAPATVGDDGKVMFILGFAGPAGANEAGNHGIGQYALAVYRNGEAWLYEKLSGGTWKFRVKFRYAPKGTTVGQAWINIHKVPFDTYNPGVNGSLIFKSSFYSGDSQNVSEQTWISSKVGAITSTKDAFIYQCPGANTGTKWGKLPTTDTQIRVASRRDLLIPFGLAVGKKPETAVMRDDPFTIPTMFRQSSSDLFVIWSYNRRTSDLTVELDLYREDGTALTPVDSGYNWKRYTITSSDTPNSVGTFYIQATFNTDGAYSPILTSYKISRPGTIVTESYGASPKTSKVRSVQLMGPEKDPQQSYVNLVIADHTNQLGLLRSRGSIPTKLDVVVNPDDPEISQVRCVLFRGYTRRVDATRKIRMLSANTGYPFYVYNVQAVSMFQRLREQVNPYHMPLYEWPLNDPDGTVAAQPLKVTDVIRGLLSGAGFPAAMLDIDDLDVRFYTTGNGIHQTIDALAEIGQTVLTFLEEYLGRFLVFDENAGDYGKWKLVEPASPPYTPKASFVFTLDEGTGPSHALVTSRAATATAGYPVRAIKKGSYKSWVKPPEANVIIASAAFKTTPTGVPEYLYQVFPNYKSADFGNGLVDPTHPDYLGRIVPMFVMLPELASNLFLEDVGGSIEHPALNWIGRRVYDVAAHAIKTVTFEAPLVLIDHEETGKYRPLRYYDPVLVDGETFLIRNVNPTYTKDFHQMAMYECEAPRV